MSSESTREMQLDMISTEYINGLYGYAMILTRNHAEAEDLVQETYVRALPAMSRLRIDSNIKGWLFKILRNIWLNQLRKRRTAAQILDTEGEDSHTEEVVGSNKDPYAELLEKTETEQVRSALQELPAEFREILLLREYQELSYREIADLLECPVGTVMSRLARARSKLRVILLTYPVFLDRS